MKVTHSPNQCVLWKDSQYDPLSIYIDPEFCLFSKKPIPAISPQVYLFTGYRGFFLGVNGWSVNLTTPGAKKILPLSAIVTRTGKTNFSYSTTKN